MTDKEIIIDGIDVSKCEYRDWRNFCCCDNSKENEGEERVTGRGGCKYNPNCYFKQLKRKEQEYKELQQYHNKCCEENTEKLEQWLEKYNQLSRDFYNGKYCNKENCGLLKAKEQECEELHSRTASIIYSLTGGRLSYSTYTLEGCEQAYHDQLEIDVERATKELQKENETLKQEVSKFKQALDEIEKYLDAQQKYFDGEDYHNLLDIINKTKKEK